MSIPEKDLQVTGTSDNSDNSTLDICTGDVKIKKPKSSIETLSTFCNRKTNVNDIHFSDLTNPHTFYFLLSQTNDVLVTWLQRNKLIASSFVCKI